MSPTSPTHAARPTSNESPVTSHELRVTSNESRVTVFALLSGGGALPSIVVEGAHQRGWRTHLVTFEDQPQPSPLPRAESSRTFPLGQIGHILAHLKAQRVTHVALAGHLHKPSILSLKPDAAGLKLLARAMMMHDDALLRAVTATLEENGYTVVSAKELAPDLLAPSGLLTKSAPTPAEAEDIVLARNTLAVLGDLDIGQAVVVYKGAILGVEAVEGTDELIRRCAELRGGEGRGGILVKRAKPLQTELADLPFVGPQTLELLIQHRYRGLAVQAGKTLLLEQKTLLDQANANNLFLTSDT